MWWYYKKILHEIIGCMLLMCQNTTMWVMDHGLKHITLYVQKHIAAFAMCYNPGIVHNKPLGAPPSVKLVYCACGWFSTDMYGHIFGKSNDHVHTPYVFQGWNVYFLLWPLPKFYIGEMTNNVFYSIFGIHYRGITWASWGLFYLQGLSLIPVSISNYINYILGVKLYLSVPDFNSATVEVWKISVLSV